MIIDIFRDAAWEGIAAVITILSVIIAIVLYLFPQLREGIRLFFFSNSRKIVSISLFIIAFLFGIYLGQYVLSNSSQQNLVIGTDPESLESFPLKLLARYDFEDAISPSNVGAWRSTYGDRVDLLLINNDPNNALSGSNSLQIQSELLDIDSRDWAGANLGGSDLPEEKILLASAWVYIPLSDQTMNRTFTGKLNLGSGETYNFGETSRIVPGEWTQLIIGGVSTVGRDISGETVRIDWPAYNGLLDLQIWHNGSAYTGAIYIDDVELYGAK